MRAYLVINFMGAFAFNESGKILEHEFFKKNPTDIANKLYELENDGILAQEAKNILNNLIIKNYKEIILSYPLVKKIQGIEILVIKNNKGEKILREEFRKFAVSLRFVATQAELNSILSETNTELTKLKMKNVIKKDKMLVRSVSILEILKLLFSF